MKLSVLNIKSQTQDAVEITFENSGNYTFKPGQYLTLLFNLNGEEVRRSYSLCSTPLEGTLSIGVKRVKGGLVSNHINDNLKIGDEVEVLPPDGRFFADVKSKNYKTYYLFSAGSGIAPILSILKTVLHTESRSFVHMIYGNSSQETIMFKEELDELQKRYADRFILVHSLSRPTNSWLSSKAFDYREGRVDKDAVQWFVNEYPPYAQDVEYYICGPGKMIDSTKNALKNIDVPDSRIFVENFGGGESNHIEGIENADLAAILNGEEININVTKGKTLLRALLDSGAKPPYSCEGGVCSSCVCRLDQGQVEMKKNLALDEKEVESGLILSCQSVPITKNVKINYNVEK